MSTFPISPDEVLSEYREVVGSRTRRFTLSATHVHVQTKSGLSSGSDVRIPLEWLTPDYATWRFHRVDSRLATSGLTVLVLSCAFLLTTTTRPPQIPFFAGMVSILLGICLLLATLASTLIPRTGYRFPNHQGVIVLDMYAIGPERNRCEAFADEVRAAILELRRRESKSI